jgi:hypothetical protein
VWGSSTQSTSFGLIATDLTVEQSIQLVAPARLAKFFEEFLGAKVPDEEFNTTHHPGGAVLLLLFKICLRPMYAYNMQFSQSGSHTLDLTLLDATIINCYNTLMGVLPSSI